MKDDIRVLSPRKADRWFPACFACGHSYDDTTFDLRTSISSPFLILKGLGTMTLGRIGEESNILRDDISTWKQRIKDSLYIGMVTYTTRDTSPEELKDFIVKDADYITQFSHGKKSQIMIVDDIVEKSLYEVEDSLTAENGATKALLQLLDVLEGRDFSGGLRLVNDLLQDHQSKMGNKLTVAIEDSMTAAFLLHNKGVLEMVNGIFNYAVHYFQESAELKGAFLGEKHKSTVETAEQLAIGLYGYRAYEESQTVFRSLHGRSTSMALTARVWNGLACLHYQMGDKEFAVKCACRAAALEDVVLTATLAMANKGYIQLCMGNADGLKTLEQAEEKLAKWLGTHNEIVQSVRYNAHGIMDPFVPATLENE